MSNFISFILVYKSLFTDIRQKMILVCINFSSVLGDFLKFFSLIVQKYFLTYQRVHAFLIVFLLLRV